MATQAERRASTRNSILVAALATLESHGLDGFTTTEVAQRSGKSQGALFRYFPTKSALLAATVEHLFAELRDAYSHEVVALLSVPDLDREEASTPTGPDALRTAVYLLWDVMSDPRLMAAFDLYTAARTDTELADALRPVVQAHVQHIRELALAVVPMLAEPSDALIAAAEAWVEPTILCMQGLAIQELAEPDLDRRTRVLHSLANHANAVLGTSDHAPGRSADDTSDTTSEVSNER